MKKKHSIKRKMTRITLACWMVPVLLMLAVVGVYMAGSHRDGTAEDLRNQLTFNLRLTRERLDGAVRLSRQASYDGKILELRREELAGKEPGSSIRRGYTEYLQAVYQQNEAVSMAVLFFPETGEEAGVSVYNARAEGSYTKLRTYWSRVHEKAAGLAQTLGTGIGFLAADGELYLVRNLVDSHYKTQAVLVICLNCGYAFESLVQFPAMEKCVVWLGETAFGIGQDGRLTGLEDLSGTLPDAEAAYARCGEERYSWAEGQLAVSEASSGEGYKIRLVVWMQREISRYPFYGYPYIIAGIAAGAVLLLAVLLIYFNREIAAPLAAIGTAARRIEEGELGTRVETEADNLELQVITDSFNSMSENLKRQFDRIYEEEVALREARIKSLQSNINPHFLNNTLEVINWEARMAGNEKVSAMIGALSAMLDASLDRSRRPMVSLEEEMSYVSAYLYIMGERMEDKLSVEIQLPKELMGLQVPRLILQPVLENAIEHGIARKGRGSVRLSGRIEGNFLILDVENDGALDAADLEKIEKLLAADYRPENTGSLHIGIANVNQRLKILFGEPCGLSVTQKTGETLARLTIPVMEKGFTDE